MNGKEWQFQEWKVRGLPDRSCEKGCESPIHASPSGATLAETARGRRALEVVTYFTLWSVRLQGFLADLEVSPSSRDLALEMLATPVAALEPREGNRRTALDLRRFLIAQIEEHVERRLVTLSHLESIE